MLERPVKQPKKAALAKCGGAAFQSLSRQETGDSGPVSGGWKRRPAKGIWSQLEAFPCADDALVFSHPPLP